MAKVSKKQLGKRRRRAALALLLILILIIACTVRCTKQEKIIEDAAIPAGTDIVQSDSSNDSSHVTNDSQIPGVLYSGSFPDMVETDLPEEPQTLPVNSCELQVTPVLQNPELPTGCEVTALTMALNYAGYPVDKITLTDKYLIKADPYEATFGEAFIGSPYDATAWGCYAPVIVETANNYLASQKGIEHVKNLTGCSLKTLLNEVANGIPVITWATIDMTTNVEERYYWTTDDGKDAVFLINEHCVLLTGYNLDTNTVIVCDPLKGRTEYDMDLFEQCYNLIYQQAVVIYSDSNTEPIESSMEKSE